MKIKVCFLLVIIILEENPFRGFRYRSWCSERTTGGNASDAADPAKPHNGADTTGASSKISSDAPVSHPSCYHSVIIHSQIWRPEPLPPAGTQSNKRDRNYRVQHSLTVTKTRMLIVGRNEWFVIFFFTRKHTLMNHSFETNLSQVVFYKYHLMFEIIGCNEVDRNERKLLLRVTETGFVFLFRCQMKREK